MATYFFAKCNVCGEECTVSGGRGFYFTLYKCKDCGKSKRIDHPERRAYEVVLLPEQIGVCEACGGEVCQNAADRCPKCKTDDISIDESSAFSVC